jgi:hypothetical protein
MNVTETWFRAGVVLILILVLFSGCGDTSVGDDPNNQEPDDSLPTENLSFSNHIQPILNNSCTSCHGAQGLSGVSLTSYNNVINSTGDCYQTLIVIPDEPGESPIVEKIVSNNPECGERMPVGGPFLSNAQVQAIQTWIQEGAEDN